MHVQWNRNDRILNKLRSQLINHSDMRICQLIWSIAGKDDPFYLTDAEFEAKLDAFGKSS